MFIIFWCFTLSKNRLFDCDIVGTTTTVIGISIILFLLLFTHWRVSVENIWITLFGIFWLMTVTTILRRWWYCDSWVYTYWKTFRDFHIVGWPFTHFVTVDWTLWWSLLFECLISYKTRIFSEFIFQTTSRYNPNSWMSCDSLYFLFHFQQSLLLTFNCTRLYILICCFLRTRIR